jgi:hypothetical protein
MKIYKKTLAMLLPAALFLPSLVFAASQLFPPWVQCDGVKVACDFSAVIRTINAIIQWFLDASVSIAAITFSIAGAKILLNPDNPSKREDAKKMFWKTVQGMIIILSAWLVIHTIIKFLDPSALTFIG